MQKYVLLAKRQSNVQWDATSWLALVVKISAICVLVLGNLIIKIISNAIFTKRNLTKS